MDNQQMFMMLPGLQPDELYVIQSITQEMTDTQKQQFISFYQGKRKDQQNLMIMTIIGFFGVAGIQRFMINEVGMGILYLFTLGFCGIGTIIDLVNIKTLTTEYNKKQAMETANMIKIMNR